MDIRTIGAFALAGFVALSAGAHAHPALKAGNPPAGGVVTGTVKELRLTFSETMVPKFSGIKIIDSKGRMIPTGLAYQDKKNSKQLVVPLKTALGKGRYQLSWYAVGKDAHRVRGSYAFTVKS